MKDFTRIVIILDRSGSMQTARESTVSGINKFIQDQQKVGSAASLKLVQFDDNGGQMDYQVVFDKPIQEVRLLTQSDFTPRGGTPLLDAQGKTITDLGEELKALSESERPNRVIVVTLTDGLENASRKYSNQQIRDMIQHQTSKYNWDFVYLGANQDAVAVGSTLGVLQSKAMSYSVSDPLAYAQAMSNLSSYVTRSRNCADPSAMLGNAFTEEERSSSLTGNAVQTTTSGGN